MEFFEMDPVTQQLLTSPQIWIYFVTAVGTTILTMVLYYMMAGFPKLRKVRNDNQMNPDYVPSNLQRGYTDIEEKDQVLCRQGRNWLVKMIKG